MKNQKIPSRSRFFYVFIFYSLFSVGPLTGQDRKDENLPPRKDRADCFFGIHFDLHAQESNDQIGKTLTNGMVDTFLTGVRPDFIQVDCKGHPGISSYPTEVGFRAAKYWRDPMKIWREETAKKGVALYVHFSGIYDKKVATEYPDWAIVDGTGKRSESILSPISPYDSVFLIPQMKELINKYDIDGAWIDGECWAALPDYSDVVMKLFRDETGITEIPKGPADKYYTDFLDFNRKLFRDHVENYTKALHDYDPDFEITSNWAFSSMMPEPVTIDLDYLSGDVTPQGGVNRAAFESRCLAMQGKPWDLMPWSFSWNGNSGMPRNTKSALQLEQEIAQIISMGGGVQVYFKQNEDLSIQPWTIPLMEELAQFSRQREAFCHHAKPVPQIALLYESETFEKGLNKIYGPAPSLNGLRGTLNALLDGQYAVEILMNHHLADHVDDYPLVVVPEWESISQFVRNILDTYVKKGGNLLVIGNQTPLQFRDELGISDFTREESKMIFLSIDDKLGALNSPTLNPDLTGEGQVFRDYCRKDDLRYPGESVSASIRAYGKGKVAAIYFNLGSAYEQYKTPVLRDYLSSMVSKLFSDPIVRISGSYPLHIAVNTLGNKLLVNLLNVSGDHESGHVLTYDRVASINNVALKITSTAKPKNIFLVPGLKKVPFKYRDGHIELVVPETEIHTIVVVEY